MGIAAAGRPAAGENKEAESEDYRRTDVRQPVEFDSNDYNLQDVLLVGSVTKEKLDQLMLIENEDYTLRDISQRGKSRSQIPLLRMHISFFMAKLS